MLARMDVKSHILLDLFWDLKETQVVINSVYFVINGLILHTD